MLCSISKNTPTLVVHYSSHCICNSCQSCSFVLLITSGTGHMPVLGTDSDAADDQTCLKSDREHKFTLVEAVKAVKIIKSLSQHFYKIKTRSITWLSSFEKKNNFLYNRR